MNRLPSLRVRPSVMTAGAPFEAGMTHRRDPFYMLMRAAGILAFAALVFVLPLEASASDRVFLAALLVGVVGPLGLAMSWKVRPERLDLAESMIDLTMVSLGGFIIPEVWTGSVVVAAMMLVAAVPVQSRRTIALMTAAVTITFTISGLMVGPDAWYSPLSAVVILMLPIDGFYRARNRRFEVAAERYDALINAAQVFIWELDVHSETFTAVAGNSHALLGYHPAEMVGMKWTDLVPKADQERIAIAAQLSTGDQLAIITGVRHQDGTVTTFRHLLTADADYSTLRGVSSDIAELAEANRRLSWQAEHDELTGLANRSVLSAALDTALADVAQTPIALMVLDLDRFKDVNDTLGHPVGDHLLKTLASRFEGTFTDATVIARLGGDEFAILVTEDVTRQRVERMAQQVVEVTQQRVVVEGVSLSTTPSIGVALAPEHGTGAESLLQRADIAMYEAKRSSDTIRFFEKTPEDLNLERLKLGSAIRPAIDEREIELWYQPKICLHTQRIVGAEGLARWRHPERGVLGPFEFLELIALAGEFGRFTDLVLEHGVETAGLCNQVGADITIAVNLASSSFFDQNLPGRIHALLLENKVRPDQLILEITESDILEEADSKITVFDRLADLGLGLSIDDFGTGYSSLTRLRALPVTELKIDRSFISRIADQEDRIIVKAIIDLSELLGHRTVAEGVEDQETAELLAQFGCAMAQGYHWAKPMPRDDFLKLIRTWPAGVGEGATVEILPPVDAAPSPPDAD